MNLKQYKILEIVLGYLFIYITMLYGYFFGINNRNGHLIAYIIYATIMISFHYLNSKVFNITIMRGKYEIQTTKKKLS